MPKHEEKRCPRCNGPFMCKQGAIQLCQCSAVELTPEERAHLAARYADCLCAACMMEERNTNDSNRLKDRIKRLLGR